MQAEGGGEALDIGLRRLTAVRRRTLLDRAEVQMHEHGPEGAPANAPQTRISARAGQNAVLLLLHQWPCEGRVGAQRS